MSQFPGVASWSGRTKPRLRKKEDNKTRKREPGFSLEPPHASDALASRTAGPACPRTTSPSRWPGSRKVKNRTAATEVQPRPKRERPGGPAHHDGGGQAGDVFPKCRLDARLNAASASSPIR